MTDQDKCVAFTGYRPEKIGKSSANPHIEHEIRIALRVVLSRMYAAGKRVFLCGMAEGFDLIAAEEVLALKDNGTCPEMEIAAIIPYIGQDNGFARCWRDIYARVLARSAYKVVLSEKYLHNCFFVRNDYLIDNSSALICYYDGQPGGTKYTVDKARKAGLPIINLCNPTLFVF